MVEKIFTRQIKKTFNVAYITKRDGKKKKIYIPKGEYRDALKSIMKIFSGLYKPYLSYSDNVDFAIARNSSIKYYNLFKLLTNEQLRLFKVDIINYFSSIRENILDKFKYIFPIQMIPVSENIKRLDDDIDIVVKIKNKKAGMNIERFIDTIKYYCFIDGKLPYGLPSSPIIASISTLNLSYRFNIRTEIQNKKIELQSFRYADDFIIGAKTELDDEKVINYIKTIFGQYGFKIRYEPIDDKEFEFLGLNFKRDIDKDSVKLNLKIPRRIAKPAAVFLDKERDKNRLNGYYGYLNPIIKVAKYTGVNFYGRHTKHLINRFFKEENNEQSISHYTELTTFKNEWKKIIKGLYKKGFRKVASRLIIGKTSLSYIEDILNKKMKKLIIKYSIDKHSTKAQMIAFKHPDKEFIVVLILT